MNRRKPTKSDFKTFWSVYEAQQQRKRDALQNRLNLPPASANEDHNRKDTP